MKAKLFAIGLFLFALAACTQKPQVVEPVETPSQALQSIDSLMWRHPDSALTRLLPWFDTCCRDAACHVSTASAYNRHYANLLLSELLYKNDYPQTNRRELRQAVGYFDSLTVLADTRGVSLQGRPRRDAWRASAQNIAFLDARAHYINGVGYYENDSAVEACKEYMKALEVMEDHFEEKELVGKKAKFMALTYTRLTELSSGYYLHKQAIYFGKMSLEYSNKSETFQRHIAWMLNKIGSQYEMIGDLDSAGQYYSKGIRLLSDTNTLTFRDLRTHLTYLSYEKGEEPQLSLKQIHILLDQAKTQKEYLSRCLTIGEIYYHENNNDSAFVYLSKVFSDHENTSLKKQAAEWLIEICKSCGRNDKIFEYAEFLVPFANQEENQSEIKSQLTELYKNFSENMLERLHQQERKKNQKWAVVIVGGFLTVMLIIVFFLYKNKIRKEHLEIKIKEEQYAHYMQQKALSGRLKKSNETLRETLKIIDEQKAENELMEIKDKSRISGQQRYEAFMQTPICQEVLDIVKQLHADKRKMLKTDSDITEYQFFALSTTQFASLSRAVEKHFPELYTTLKKIHPAISQKDWKFCLLYLMQLDKKSICVLLQESYHTCRRYTMKLEEVFNCQQGLSVFLIEQIFMF